MSFCTHPPTHVSSVMDSRSLGRGRGFNLIQSVPDSFMCALHNTLLSSLNPFMENYGQITPLKRLGRDLLSATSSRTLRDVCGRCLVPQPVPHCNISTSNLGRNGAGILATAQFNRWANALPCLVFDSTSKMLSS